MRPLYLHGLPGSGAELDLTGASLPVLDRDAPSFAQLALSLPEGPLHLIGFSLGGACALRLAALASDKVVRVSLISGAAPLELGAFLPRMAGAPVFRLAHSHARLGALTHVQSALARISPGLLLKMLSRDTDPADAALMSDPATGPVIRRAVAEGLTKGRTSYLREISAYVMPWGRHLAHVSCPVTLHHGDADRWAPFDMAEAVARALPNAHVVRYAGLGHYSTLCAALPTLTADAGTEAC